MGLPETGHQGTCLVTGASSGIGAELARQLALRGRAVTLLARRRDRLEELAEDLRRVHRVRAEVLAADLSEEEARAAIPAWLAERHLEVEVLVNNAGFTTMGPVATARREAELTMVRTNVEAVVDLCTMLVPDMVARGRGAVLNVASAAAYQPLPGQAGYAATKSFVLSYSWALRAELAHTGVTVTALCPGPVETGFQEAAGMSQEQAAGALPKVMWVPAPKVAAAGVAGLEQEKAVVIPGAANRAGALAGHLAPRGIVTRFVAAQHPAVPRP